MENKNIIFENFINKRIQYLQDDKSLKVLYKDIFKDLNIKISSGCEPGILKTETGYTFYLEENTSRLRDNFTIAKMLGYILLNKFTQNIFFPLHQKINNNDEWLTNNFASSFLLPKQNFIKKCVDFDFNDTHLSEFFEVSKSAILVTMGVRGIKKEKIKEIQSLRISQLEKRETFENFINEICKLLNITVTDSCFKPSLELCQGIIKNKETYEIIISKQIGHLRPKFNYDLFHVICYILLNNLNDGFHSFSDQDYNDCIGADKLALKILLPYEQLLEKNIQFQGNEAKISEVFEVSKVLTLVAMAVYNIPDEAQAIAPGQD